MSIEIVKELLQDADLLGFIRAGAYSDEYDRTGKRVMERLSPDLTVEQIARVLWDALYYDFLVCTIGNSNEYFTVGKKEAVRILGDTQSYVGIAKTIRRVVYKL